MRPFPSDTDAEVVVAFDGHSKTRPVSVMWLIDEVRQSMESPMSTDALEMLAVEMATARHLPVMLDRTLSRRDVASRPREPEPEAGDEPLNATGAGDRIVVRTETGPGTTNEQGEDLRRVAHQL